MMRAPTSGGEAAGRGQGPAALPRRAMTLLIVLLLLFTFVAVAPLLLSQRETSFRRAQVLENWSRLQWAADSGLFMAASCTAAVPARFATFTYEDGLVVRCEAQRTAADSVLASVSAFVASGSGWAAAGFDRLILTASVSEGLAATFTHWMMRNEVMP